MLLVVVAVVEVVVPGMSLDGERKNHHFHILSSKIDEVLKHVVGIHEDLRAVYPHLGPHDMSHGGGMGMHHGGSMMEHGGMHHSGGMMGMEPTPPYMMHGGYPGVMPLVLPPYETQPRLDPMPPMNMESPLPLSTFSYLIGQPISSTFINYKGDIRIIRPYDAVTADYQTNRLNVYLDANDIITQLNFG